MKRILSVYIVGCIICTLAVGINIAGKASRASNEKPVKNEENGLTLSDMQVKITAMGHTATFRLYDTVAAKEFYDQLPLKLE